MERKKIEDTTAMGVRTDESWISRSRMSNHLADLRVFTALYLPEYILVIYIQCYQVIIKNRLVASNKNIVTSVETQRTRAKYTLFIHNLISLVTVELHAGRFKAGKA